MLLKWLNPQAGIARLNKKGSWNVNLFPHYLYETQAAVTACKPVRTQMFISAASAKMMRRERVFLVCVCFTLRPFYPRRGAAAGCLMQIDNC